MFFLDLPIQDLLTSNCSYQAQQNPHKLCLGPGGSSGGEGALLAMRASLLGFGTDIGGSVRIPALCCGLFGLKPTVDRIPYFGQVPFVRDGYPPDVSCAAGPLAHSARDIHFILRTIVESKPWTYDHTALATPWTPSSLKNPITVGCIIEDPHCAVASPVSRAMRTAIEKLHQAGLKVIMLDEIPSFEVAANLTWSYFDLDNHLTPFKDWPAATGEPLVLAVEKMYRSHLDTRRSRTLEELFEMNIQRSAFRRRWHEIFISNSLDVILAPSNRSTALLHDEYGKTAYTAMWNLVNVSSVRRARVSLKADVVGSIPLA
jgi:amidase